MFRAYRIIHVVAQLELFSRLQMKLQLRFEALEYAGILKEARRSSRNKQLLAQSRDYCLRTVDSIRHDVRNQLEPTKLHRRLKLRMEKDKSGTVGFGTGAFLGFAL